MTMRSSTRRVVGIAELVVTTDPAEVLVTHSLGSCVGLALYDPVKGVGGMLHAMLPVSTLDPTRAAANPPMFTDTGVAALLRGVFDLGATRADLVAVVAGASNVLDPQGLFRIGERNHLVLRRMLWKNGILIADEDVGGTATRTLTLEMATGRTTVKTGGTTRVLHPGTEGSTR
jgi:chemotaxis protein CheD